MAKSRELLPDFGQSTRIDLGQDDFFLPVLPSPRLRENLSPGVDDHRMPMQRDARQLITRLVRGNKENLVLDCARPQ